MTFRKAKASLKDRDKSMKLKEPVRTSAEGEDTGENEAKHRDSLVQYFSEIARNPLIDKHEERRLAKKIHGRNKRASRIARTSLIVSNLRLVVKIAHDFKGYGLPLSDLISEGNIGLMKAAEKFDPEKGAKFSSYAAWWIKQSMRRGISNQSRTIRIPVQSESKIRKLRGARHLLKERLGREASHLELAEHLGFSERTVASLRRSDMSIYSLQEIIGENGEGELQDLIPDTNSASPDVLLDGFESTDKAREFVNLLDERERNILVLRFGLDGRRPKTLEEVSQKIGRTRERVRQIQNQALSRLKGMMAGTAYCYRS